MKMRQPAIGIDYCKWKVQGSIYTYVDGALCSCRQARSIYELEPAFGSASSYGRDLQSDDAEAPFDTETSNKRNISNRTRRGLSREYPDQLQEDGVIDLKGCSIARSWRAVPGMRTHHLTLKSSLIWRSTHDLSQAPHAPQELCRVMAQDEAPDPTQWTLSAHEKRWTAGPTR